MNKSCFPFLASLLLICLFNNDVYAQCNTNPCVAPTAAVNAQEACILPGPSALNDYFGATFPSTPESFPPSWCTTVENNHFFAFTADSQDVTFDLCCYDCAPGGAIQAAILSTLDCINFQFVSPCLGHIASETCQTLTASNLIVGQNYYLMIDGSAGAICNYSINGKATVPYTPSTEDFANPERGFMQFTETTSSNYTPLDTNSLAIWRNLNQPFGADYAIYSTLGYRGFYLESFTNSPISATYLNAMQVDFDAAREAGVKLVVRFAYTHKDTPPYGDAPKTIVLQHIEQLKPILQANADVIAVLNMGFIGAWGEGYYTDYFGDDSQPPYGLTAQNWNDRTEVLNALLDAMPPDRSVQVRVPQMKQKAVYSASAPTNSASLTLSEAWQNTAKARIGFHNDCFLSSYDDQGTFKNYDTGVSGSDTTAFKPYFSNDSQFVPVGGETCIDWDPYSNCVGQPGGGAQNEMARMHFSYLNAGWNNAVNNDWVSGGCMEEIKQRLGYRLELQKGEFPTEGRPGQTILVKIDLQNKGFAAPFNARKVRLLMRNIATSDIWHVELSDDPRSWLPGTQIHTLKHAFCLPEDMPIGKYELLLHLADPYSSLSDRPEYAIRLANENTWEPATGFNKLLHQINVNNTANKVDCGGETCFQPAILTPPTANFTASATSGCAPLTVTYLNQTASCWTYEWSFPGGIPSTSSEANPTVVYQNSGVFAVSLSVTNVAGTGYNSMTLLVSESPVITFANGTLSSTPASAYQWLLNGNPIPGATGQTFVPTVTGEYSVQVDCPGSGWVASNIVSVVIVGVSEASLWQMKIYPNPVSDTENMLTLELQGLDNQPVTIVLTDLAGREFLQKMETRFAGKTILDTGAIPPGSYFVQVRQDGKMAATGMFLKI